MGGVLLSADADAGFDTQALARQAIIDMLKQHWSAAVEATSPQTDKPGGGAVTCHD